MNSENATVDYTTDKNTTVRKPRTTRGKVTEDKSPVVVPENICEYCRKEIPKNAKVCPYCTKKVKTPKPKRISKKDIDLDLMRETKVVIGKSLKFSEHLMYFSKFAAFLFIIMYSMAFLVYLAITIKSYLCSGIFETAILDFVLSPTQVILMFYFGSKTVENVSQGICNLFLRKIAIENDIDNFQTNNF